MEPPQHGCSGRLCKQWRLKIGALLCGMFLGISASSSSQAAPSADSHGLVKGEDLQFSVSNAQLPSAIPSRVDPVTNGTSATLTSYQGSEHPEAKIDGSRVHGNESPASIEENERTKTPQSAFPKAGGGGLGDRQIGVEGENPGNLEVENLSEKSLSVAERVRMRFHSQRLFQDDIKSEDRLALDPLPQSALEEMLKDAQEDSTSTEARTKVICLSNCSMHGECTPYGCSCAVGWGGVDCSSRSCAKNCSGNGVCVDGECKCTAGFLGVDCSESENDDSESGECPNDCSGNGVCNPFTRQCTCNDGFVGRSCGEERCPNNCLPNGQCADNGRCSCQLGYGGADCSVEICPKNCSGLGICSSIGCLCYEGSGGVDCSQPQKASRATPFGCATEADCSNRGSCESGRCNCNTGFEGDCSELARDVFSAVCKHSSSLYVLAFDANIQPGIKTW